MNPTEIIQTIVHKYKVLGYTPKYLEVLLKYLLLQGVGQILRHNM